MPNLLIYPKELCHNSNQILIDLIFQFPNLHILLQVKLHQLGFDYCYDKALLDKLEGNAFNVNDYIHYKGEYFFGHVAHFVENHDENRVVYNMQGNLEKARAAGTIAATLGGMIFFNHGQWSGLKNKLDVHLRRGASESADISDPDSEEYCRVTFNRGGRSFTISKIRCFDEDGNSFWYEEDDHPMIPEPYGIAGWTQDDQDVLLYDHYDIWKISTGDGKAINLTDGNGRRTKCTYRYIPTKDQTEEPFIRNDETIMLSVFNNITKENGLATVNVAKAAAPKIAALGGYTYGNPQKAKDAEVYAYTKGNFQCPNDIYLTYTPGRREQKLTSINPQQKDYNWGTVELFHWNAFDGTQLDGLLYKPEDFDPTKKYPVMIYFYEKRSESMYNYIMPQPSWSTVNLAFYCSRGYIVFVPDIVYHAGTPGESAYNCIVSGAEALARNTWVDKDNMAIQGQSWGGYQVAYLITRTNMFKAAGAGAPVANMTSAYGGIRWQTGMSRQFQYEQSQSRIGRDLWNGVELYMENSPLFKLPHVSTPVLIMHNDNDGAVPWYQGIEMFMGLRRLGKPAWLLEYNNEEHNLKERRNRKDLTIRLQQFFDHYLKNAPMPAWMKNGVPTSRKGEYFGFEYVE